MSGREVDIDFDCPLCGGNILVNSIGAGRSLPCPHCKQLITIPRLPFGLRRWSVLAVSCCFIGLLMWTIIRIGTKPKYEERVGLGVVAPQTEMTNTVIENTIAESADLQNSDTELQESEQPASIANTGAWEKAVEGLQVQSSLPSPHFRPPQEVSSDVSRPSVLDDTQTSRIGFGDLSSSLVIINTDLGSGTGFVVEQHGTKYVVSNQHVLQATEFISLTLLDGRVTLNPERLELAVDRDLARIPLNELDIPALLVRSINPSLNDDVTVYGNSEGDGVITELKGQVIGVGPYEVETSAEFVQGNSGSPVIDGKGLVMAVATYAKPVARNPDWVQWGTRFAGARRFCLRLDCDIQYKKVSTDTFMRQCKLLLNADLYLSNVFNIMLCWSRAPERKEAIKLFESYVFKPQVGMYYDSPWHEKLAAFSNRYLQYWIKRIRYKSDKGLLSDKSSLVATFTHLTHEPKKAINTCSWASEHLQAQANDYLWYIDLADREISAIVKSDAWETCVIESLLKKVRESSPRSAYY